ncbi:hypothetical protein KY092_07815 [Natronomonas gomsonensis]|uniref:hypothetical protein n=1 Tax=Natronomonas gomsonensis TaxID=1046043 RepID=UPI0020CA7276|nr:hypothetical protein [Natronomonas gomsonensis]MCY4730462.1 hypothetical protein [Natronomonas gomsonensis]
MKLRSWLTSDKEEQADEPVEVAGLELDGDGEVLESGHDIQQFEQDIESREETIDQLEREVSRHQKKKEKAFDKARGASTESDKNDYMVEAKEHKVAGEKKEKILDHLRSEKLTLTQLKLQHLQNNIRSGAIEGLDIDLSELSTRDIESAIEEGEDQLIDASENMDDLDQAMDLADEELSGVDISDIKSEVKEEDNGINLSDRSLETEEEIDRAIEEEYEKIEEMKQGS